MVPSAFPQARIVVVADLEEVIAGVDFPALIMYGGACSVRNLFSSTLYIH